MNTRIVNLKNSPDVKEQLQKLNGNKTYKILITLKAEPQSRSSLERTCPYCWYPIKNAIKKHFIEKKRNNKYYITEDGLDKIDLLKLEYGVYQG